MAKEKKNVSQQPRVNPELLEVERDYRRDTLIVEAQPILKRIVFLVWGVLDVLLVSVFVLSVGMYLVSGIFRDRNSIASIGNNLESIHAVTLDRAARPIQIRPAQLFALGEGEYDFYAVIENRNADWYATFDYYFSTSQGDTSRKVGSVMPGESKGLVSLRQEFGARPNGNELILENVEWRRVPAGEIVDSESWLAERNKFTVTNASYSFDVELADEDLPKTSFTISNDTPYAYWTPEFLVTIVRAGAVAGVNLVTVPSFASGDVRDVDVTWFGEVPSSGTVIVTPNINYFDEDVYMPPGGESGSDLRDTVNDRRR